MPIPATNAQAAIPFAVGPHISTTKSIVEMTQFVFGDQDEVRAVDKQDPEMPGEAYVMIQVTSRLSDEEILHREDQWHRRLREVAGGQHSRFSICIDAQ